MINARNAASPTELNTEHQVLYLPIHCSPSAERSQEGAGFQILIWSHMWRVSQCKEKLELFGGISQAEEKKSANKLSVANSPHAVRFWFNTSQKQDKLADFLASEWKPYKQSHCHKKVKKGGWEEAFSLQNSGAASPVQTGSHDPGCPSGQEARQGLTGLPVQWGSTAAHQLQAGCCKALVKNLP